MSRYDRQLHRLIRQVAVIVALPFCCSVLPATARAGSLCATVRDGQTAAPLSGALVLTYTPAGVYAGFAAITAADGTCCMAGIPAGVYDLQVRVRNHLVGTMRNVQVRDGVTGIIVEGRGPVLLLEAFPNPARGETRISLSAEGASRVRLGVCDIRGRFLRGWTMVDPDGGEHVLSWDFRDAAGREVSPGVYFLILTTDVGSTSRRVVRLP